MAQPDRDQAQRIAQATRRLDALHLNNESHRRVGAFDARRNGSITLSLDIDDLFILISLAEKGKGL